MGEILSMDEIKARFPSEWVLLQDPRTTESLEVTAGEVLWHSNDRDEIYRKAGELKPEHWAVLYLGSIPEDLVIVL